MDVPENWHWTDAPSREMLGDMSPTMIQPVGVGSSVRRHYELPVER